MGPFGFFSTGRSGADNAAGNYAVWDALQALKFLRKTAAAFGGNRDNIVLTGQGAGGVLSNTLSYSCRSRGMYSKVL